MREGEGLVAEEDRGTAGEGQARAGERWWAREAGGVQDTGRARIRGRGPVARDWWVDMGPPSEGRSSRTEGMGKGRGLVGKGGLGTGTVREGRGMVGKERARARELSEGREMVGMEP